MLIAKKIRHFILKTAIFALSAGLLYSLSDSIWSLFDVGVKLKENFFQRSGYYSLFVFVFTYAFGIFILFILNDVVLSRKPRLLLFLSMLLFAIGIGLGYVTQGDGWELYIGKQHRIKHILMFGLVLGLYPLISFYMNKRRAGKSMLA